VTSVFKEKLLKWLQEDHLVDGVNKIPKACIYLNIFWAIKKYKMILEFAS